MRHQASHPDLHRHMTTAACPRPGFNLRPLRPISQAERVRLAVRDGTPPPPPLQSSPAEETPPQPLRHRRVLRRVRSLPSQDDGQQPQEQHDCCEHHHGHSSSRLPPGYTVDRILHQHPVSEVSILLATPLSLQQGSTGPCLVSSTSKVVIKAVPQAAATNTTKQRADGFMGDQPLRELAALQHLMSHEHLHHRQPSTTLCQPAPVIPLLDCLQDEDYIYLVLPFLTGGDLFSRVKATDEKGLDDVEAASYLRQMAEGLLFMKKSCGLAHHDVSLENAMLTNKQDGVVQLIDLGMALQVPEMMESMDGEGGSERSTYLTPQRCSGKPAYVAPEVVREEACDPFAADVWSLGICLYMMLTARPLYNSPRDQTFRMLSKPGGAREVVTVYEKYGLCLSSAAKDLVCSMLHANPCMRPTLEEVLSHPFLAIPQEDMQ